jgi:hypothetical protein
VKTLLKENSFRGERQLIPQTAPKLVHNSWLNINDCLYIDDKFAIDLISAGVTVMKVHFSNLFPKFIVIY